MSRSPSSPLWSGWRSALRDGIDSAREKLDELEADEVFGPSVSEGRRIAASGSRAVASAYQKTASAVTQEEAWAATQELLEELVEIVSIQQGMLEQLRERVVELERS